MPWKVHNYFEPVNSVDRLPVQHWLLGWIRRPSDSILNALPIVIKTTIIILIGGKSEVS
jgi:uncharacterized SAM-binding protein YcdF (DUF218 family)